MRVRGLDGAGDWTFGKGANNYKTDLLAVAQNIQTRVMSFRNDCFFAKNDGIDCYNLIGYKNQVALNLAVSATVLGPQNGISAVTGILQLIIRLDDKRQLEIRYRANTVYSTKTLSGAFSYNTGTLGQQNNA